MKLAMITFRPPAETILDQLFTEDIYLASVLHTRDFDVTRIAWDDPDADWSVFDLALIRSPWDYHERYHEFMSWLERRHREGLRMYNPYEMLRWNSDKHYLKDISDAGLPVIPSAFVEQGSQPDLLALFSQLGREKLIVKPCISGGARNTRVLKQSEAIAFTTEFRDWLLTESYMVQPFMEEVNDGEWSFLFFNGTFSHALLKVPKAGDFRVQHTHGGAVHWPEPTKLHLQQAAAYINQFARGSLYARVDAVVVNGALCLMELELIEPFLFVESATGAAEMFADALVAMLDQPVNRF